MLAAREFFSSSKNAAFFFSQMCLFDRYFGKFSKTILAQELRAYYSQKNKNDIDYSLNALRAFILRFDCRGTFLDAKIEFENIPIYDKYYYDMKIAL